MIPKFQIGDTVWRPTFEASAAWVQCPDCCGEGRLRVIMGDETIVSIDCDNCKRGYDGPQGVLKVYNRRPYAECEAIMGIRMEGAGINYQTNGTYTASESSLFVNEADALKAADVLADTFCQEERERILRKEKDTRSWAWNATYHRREIKSAQERIAYHSSKLAVASLKAKEDKRETAS